MSNERIDLQWLLEEDGLMQDLNWSIARFEQVEKLVKEMTAELKRCYEEMDELSKFAQEILIEEEPGYWVYDEERHPNAALDALDLLRSFIPTSE